MVGHFQLHAKQKMCQIVAPLTKIVALFGKKIWGAFWRFSAWNRALPISEVLRTLKSTSNNEPVDISHQQTIKGKFFDIILVRLNYFIWQVSKLSNVVSSCIAGEPFSHAFFTLFIRSIKSTIIIAGGGKWQRHFFQTLFINVFFYVWQCGKFSLALVFVPSFGETRVVYDRVRKRKNYFEIPAFLQIDVLNFPALDFPCSIWRKAGISK